MKRLFALLAAPLLLAGCATPYPEPQVELAHTPVVNLPPMQPLPADFGSYRQLGLALYTDWVLAFEMTSLLLLAAIIGAVILAKRRLGS